MTDIVSTISRLDRAGFGHADIARLAKCSLAKVRKHVPVKADDHRFDDFPTPALREQAKKISAWREQWGRSRNIAADGLLDEEVKFLRLCSPLELSASNIAEYLTRCGSPISRSSIQNACQRLGVRLAGPGVKPRRRVMAEA